MPSSQNLKVLLRTSRYSLLIMQSFYDTVHNVLKPAVTNINTKTIFKCNGNSNFNET